LSQFAQVAVNWVEFSVIKKQYGSVAYKRAQALQRLLNRLEHANTNAKLEEVNRFFNRFKYESDESLWKQKDYWQTPTEFIGIHAGDCEDYVISKYFALRALGIPDEKLFLTYAKAIRKSGNIAHMVLNYFETPDSVPLVLGNYNHEIVSALKRKDLIPVYSFNAKSLFLSNSAGLGQALPTSKIKNGKWERLLQAIKRAKT
jgi:predicted transglutaminase-like cysteine proteinase